MERSETFTRYWGNRINRTLWGRNTFWCQLEWCELEVPYKNKTRILYLRTFGRETYGVRCKLERALDWEWGMVFWFWQAMLSWTVCLPALKPLSEIEQRTLTLPLEVVSPSNTIHSKLSDFNLPLHSVSYVHLSTQHFGACWVPCTGDIKLNESRSYKLPVLESFLLNQRDRYINS